MEISVYNVGKLSTLMPSAGNLGKVEPLDINAPQKSPPEKCLGLLNLDNMSS